jgi:hypothetical protein
VKKLKSKSDAGNGLGFSIMSSIFTNLMGNRRREHNRDREEDEVTAPIHTNPSALPTGAIDIIRDEKPQNC